MGDEQQHNARALLDSIAERHFPQRFEHPLLRLFRLSAAVLLPAYLLVGLLSAIQIPSTIQVHTQTALAFPAPLLDLTRFPNEVIDGRVGAFTADKALLIDPVKLTQLANSAVQLQPSPPRLDPLGTIKVVLIIMGIYLIMYTLFGLAVIGFSSPAQFQGRRPGRLILRKDSLGWHGPAGQGSVMEALEWIRQDARSFGIRLLRPVTGLFGRATLDGIQAGPEVTTLPLADIESALAVDRRAFGFLLRDFSFTLLKPREPKPREPKPRAPKSRSRKPRKFAPRGFLFALFNPRAPKPRKLGPRELARRTFVIPGSIVHYEELCDELELRMHRQRQPFSVEIFRSGWGICFLLTLVYTLVLAALLPLAPTTLNTPLPVLGYSLINLYVLATPGLLIPLVWWFVAQPLGANSNVSWASLPLAAAALAGGALTAAVLLDQVTLASIGLRPDLATPVLATGVLVALVCYAPPRPFRRMAWLKLGHLARLFLAIAALAGLTLLTWHIVTTLRWYNALVQGNRLIEQSLAPGGCASRTDGCTLVDDAIDNYSNVICRRPDDGDGYAFRGFAYLVKHSYQQARNDFERALGERPPADACAMTGAPSPTPSERARLYADIGAVDTLLARQPPLSNADIHYQDALRSYARALNLPTDDFALGCSALALNLLRPEGSVDAVLGLDLLSPSGAIKPEQAPVVLQLADACYSRGSTKAEPLSIVARMARSADRDAARQSAWKDLAAAVAEYRAVVAASDDSKDRELARRGLAAAWLALSQLDPPPVGAPDRRTALLQALATYQELEQSGQRDPTVYMGQAWSSIQLGAWDSAKPPLVTASKLAPDDPTYPALQGLAAWLDSTQYPVAKKGVLSPGYTAAISNALLLYSDVIRIGKVDLSRAYATRSLLYFSLRNSPRGEAYIDEDYSARMYEAIADASQALLAAEHAGQPAERQVGYRYWRARLSFTLALTWQEKSRGPHEWAELAPLYSSAYADFTTAADADLNPERRKYFRDAWIPWSGALFGNATHMQLATEAARAGNFARARGELALVDLRTATFKSWGDVLSAPLPDYHFLHGLVSLGLGMPTDFPNPLIKHAADAPASDAEASYSAAITMTENADIVPQPNNNYPDDSRPAIYRAALVDLDQLLAKPPTGWSPAARAAAERVRATVQERLDAVAK
jgi:hypothetical protein